VAPVREKNVYRVLVGKHEGQNELEDVGSDGRIILKWILQKQE
jgi:hypothetical protein